MTWPRTKWVSTVAALVLYLTLVLGFQRIAGAPSAPFGAYPDESSHYVSGLLIHDYLLHGIGQSPTAYGYQYYIHDPYIGIGWWPPMYYVAEALWMLCFGTDRAAALWLTAFIAASGATLIFGALRKNLGNTVAFGAGLLFLLIPIVQWSSTLVMTDMAVATLSFAAALALARYLDSGESHASVMFAGFAAMAALTKASAFFLAGVPPAAVLASGRLGLLKRSSFWLMPILVAIIVAPWYVFARRFAGLGFQGLEKHGFAQTLAQLSALMWVNIGWLALLALIGLWSLLRARPVPGIAVVCAIQPVAVVVFVALAPTGSEPRFLIAAFPPLIVLAAYGIRALVAAAHVKRRERLLASCLTAAIVLVAAHFWLFRFDLPRSNEFRPIADYILGHTNPIYTTVLINADAEGPMIAEIAGRDPQRANRFLIRPGKLFAHMNWSGGQYELRRHSPQEVQALINRLPISLAIVRRSPPPGALPHELLLLDAIHAFPERWRAVRSFCSEGRNYDLFEPVSKSAMSCGKFEAYLADLLGSSLHREK